MPDRDWQKDWEMCEQATPEPWEVEGIGGIRMDGQRDCYAIAHNSTRLNKPHFSHHDARFIAEARQALPYWLQRVRELEQALHLAYHALTEGMSDVPPDQRSPKCAELRREAKRAIRKLIKCEEDTE